VTGTRTVRGRETERLIAQDLRANGALNASAVAASLGGRDILGVPGLAIEIKSRKSLDIQASLRQAQRNAGSDLPLVVVRFNGQGPAHIDQWGMFAYWGTCKTLLREAGYLP
jgi:hypothetical protein